MGHLGPAQIGNRVIVRRILPGQVGPTGGPAMTDVLGVMESWADGITTVRREDGSVVSIETAHIVSGKPVPPRASRFSRLAPEVVLRHAEGGFRRLESRRLGEWELRYVGGTNPRPNSVLAAGDPGLALSGALSEVTAFYAAHDLPAVALVVAGSALDDALRTAGWAPHGTENDVLVAGVAALARTLRGADVRAVHHEDRVSREWLVGNSRAQAHFDVVSRTLDLSEAVFASLSDAGTQVARARTSIADDWAFLADLHVHERHRRQGHARALVADAVAWAAERGATSMVLDVDVDNVPAQRLYASLGFERHHACRLLHAPD